MNCPDFEGRITCDHFIANGACKRPDKFMCHVFIDTGKQPIVDDVPEHLGRVLEAIPSAKVIEEKKIKEKKKQEKPKQQTMEDFFGKITV